MNTKLLKLIQRKPISFGALTERKEVDQSTLGADVNELIRLGFAELSIIFDDVVIVSAIDDEFAEMKNSILIALLAESLSFEQLVSHLGANKKRLRLAKTVDEMESKNLIGTYRGRDRYLLFFVTRKGERAIKAMDDLGFND